MNKVKIINLSGYETPSIKESTRYDWVEYGDSNNYFGELIEKYTGSPTNSRCVNGISDLIYGRGLNATDSEDNAVQFGQMQQILQDKDIRRNFIKKALFSNLFDLFHFGDLKLATFLNLLKYFGDL